MIKIISFYKYTSIVLNEYSKGYIGYKSLYKK